MSRYVAKFREDDSPYGEEVYISIEGVEYGFMAVPDNGDEFDMYPSTSPEEAREDLEHFMSDMETFEWLEEE